MQDFQNEVNAGLHNIYELCGNLVNICVRLDQEEGKSYNGHKIYLNTLEKSIIFFEYNIFETVTNFISHITVNLNSGYYLNAPLATRLLSEQEVLFLMEKELKLKDGKESIRTKFVPTSIKLKQYPHLFGKIFDTDYKLSIGNTYWEKFKLLTVLRHELTHPKFQNNVGIVNQISNPLMDFESIQSIVKIQASDLFNGLTSLRWYIRTMQAFISELGKPELKILSKGFEIMDSFCYMSMVSISNYCGKTERDIEQLFPR